MTSSSFWHSGWEYTILGDDAVYFSHPVGTWQGGTYSIVPYLERMSTCCHVIQASVDTHTLPPIRCNELASPGLDGVARCAWHHFTTARDAFIALPGLPPVAFYEGRHMADVWPQFLAARPQTLITPRVLAACLAWGHRQGMLSDDDVAFFGGIIAEWTFRQKRPRKKR